MFLAGTACFTYLHYIVLLKTRITLLLPDKQAKGKLDLHEKGSILSRCHRYQQKVERPFLKNNFMQNYLSK